MEINFDMDGTLVDLYGVKNWLAMLQNEDTTPYATAKPLVNFSQLARLLNKLTALGYEVNVISWLSKNGSADYNERVAQVKREYLAKHLPSVKFTKITILAYGTPKENFGTDILFDDEECNRKNWKGTAYDEKNIVEILKKLLTV